MSKSKLSDIAKFLVLPSQLQANETFHMVHVCANGGFGLSRLFMVRHKTAQGCEFSFKDADEATTTNFYLDDAAFTDKPDYALLPSKNCSQIVVNHCEQNCVAN